MEKKKSNANIVLALGIVGITGILLTIISDVILLGSPISAYSFIKLRTECMSNIAQWRITLGVFVGVFALPFQIAGLISVYRGLKPSGRVMPLFVVIADAHALVMGVAFHMSYAFIAGGWKLYYASGTENKNVSEIVKEFDFYWKVLISIMLTELLAGSIIFVWLIMTGKTLYPKWIALLNPLCILILVFFTIILIPAPAGGYIAPAYLNISTLVFLSFSTVVIHKRFKNKEDNNCV